MNSFEGSFQALVSKAVPVGLYLVTAYTNVQVSNLGGSGKHAINCNVGTDEAGHNITRFVKDNVEETTTPWHYSVFIGTTAGHSTITLKCSAGAVSDDGTFFDPQLEILSVSSIQ
jgi:hypothetical protein